MISYGNLLLFSGNDSFNSSELWRSDGSTAGTQMVKNIHNVMNTQYPGILVPSNFGLYFVPGGQPTQTLLYPIWKSDGSVSGTVPLPGNGVCEGAGVWKDPAKLPILATIGDILFYPGSQCDLWRTDGTVEGTWKVPGEIPNTYSNPQFTLMPVGDLMLFVLDYYGSKELWVTDGTQDPSGTEKIKLLGPACDKIYLPVAPVTYKNEVYFITTPDVRDCGDNYWWKLWKSDGTSTGTQVVKMADSIYNAWEPKFLALAGDLLFFLANDDQNRYLLWESDGTTPGTRPVDLTSRVAVANMVGSNDYLYIFSNLEPCYGCWSPTLYKTRGKDRGGVQLAHALKPYTLPPSEYAYPPEMVSAGGKLYFTHNNGELPHQLWVSDGTSSGTHIVLTTGNQPVYASNLYSAGGRLFFTGKLSADAELWTSDGTPSGTYQVADINPGSENPSYPDHFTWANRNLFFYANNGVEGVELWVTYRLSLLTDRLNLPLIQR